MQTTDFDPPAKQNLNETTTRTPHAQTMPPTPPTSLTPLYAKWTSCLPLPTPEGALPKSIDRYQVLIPPHVPLAIGLEVKIKALSRIAFHIPPGTLSLTKYDTYDPSIWGKLVSIRASTLDMVEYVLFNEAPNRTVVFAYIAIQRIPGYSTELESWMGGHGWCRDHELFLPFIPLETATIALLDAIPRPDETEEDKGHEPARSYLAHTVRVPDRMKGPRKHRRTAGGDSRGARGLWSATGKI